MPQRQKDISRKVLDLLLALVIGAIGPVIAILTVRSFVTPLLFIIVLILSTVSLAWMMKEICRILWGSEQRMTAFLAAAACGTMFILFLSEDEGAFAIEFGIITLILFAGTVRRQGQNKNVTERSAEAEEEAARMEQERQQALDQEEAVFTDWEDGSEPGEKKPEGAGNEKE